MTRSSLIDSSAGSTCKRVEPYRGSCWRVFPSGSRCGGSSSTRQIAAQSSSAECSAVPRCPVFAALAARSSSRHTSVYEYESLPSLSRLAKIQSFASGESETRFHDFRRSKNTPARLKVRGGAFVFTSGTNSERNLDELPQNTRLRRAQCIQALTCELNCGDARHAIWRETNQLVSNATSIPAFHFGKAMSCVKGRCGMRAFQKCAVKCAIPCAPKCAFKGLNATYGECFRAGLFWR